MTTPSQLNLSKKGKNSRFKVQKERQWKRNSFAGARLRTLTPSQEGRKNNELRQMPPERYSYPVQRNKFIPARTVRFWCSLHPQGPRNLSYLRKIFSGWALESPHRRKALTKTNKQKTKTQKTKTKKEKRKRTESETVRRKSRCQKIPVPKGKQRQRCGTTYLSILQPPEAAAPRGFCADRGRRRGERRPGTGGVSTAHSCQPGAASEDAQQPGQAAYSNLSWTSGSIS